MAPGPKKGTKPPTREQTIERERKVWSLRQQGRTQEQIADELGIDQSTVSKMLGRLSRAASKELVGTLVEEKYAQLAQLRLMISEAMRAWERSKAQDKTMTRKDVGIGSNAKGITTSTVKVEDTDGNPAYLSAAMNAQAAIRKLLGLDSPTKVIDLTRLESATDEQLERIVSGEDPLVVFGGSSVTDEEEGDQ